MRFVAHVCTNTSFVCVPIERMCTYRRANGWLHILVEFSRIALHAFGWSVSLNHSAYKHLNRFANRHTHNASHFHIVCRVITSLSGLIRQINTYANIVLHLLFAQTLNVVRNELEAWWKSDRHSENVAIVALMAIVQWTKLSQTNHE